MSKRLLSRRVDKREDPPGGAGPARHRGADQPEEQATLWAFTSAVRRRSFARIGRTHSPIIWILCKEEMISAGGRDS